MRRAGDFAPRRNLHFQTISTDTSDKKPPFFDAFSSAFLKIVVRRTVI